MRKPSRTSTAAPRAPALAANGGSPAGQRRAGLLAALGQHLRALRTGRGLSQRDLAARAGLSPRFVAQLEAGAGNISLANLAELARALETPLAALLDESSDGAGALPGNGAHSAAHAAPASDAAVLHEQIAAALAGRSPAELRALLAELRRAPAGEATGQAAAARSIALLGLRGAGKSTLGPLLAAALRRPFVELDEAIQDASGLALSEIFELHGEGYYRQAERQALQQVLAREAPVVLAVSGGAVTDPALFRLLGERTLRVWVRATPEQHMARVASQGDRRPMANRPDAMTELRALLRARTPFYEQAALVADTSAATPRACVRRLVADLERLGAA